ncbi:MAG: aspartate kinase [Thaumarchaeota archaeon]|nr:aspartate kinase [Nitrososphaerota archaeon]MDE1832673.1 aspartate kinase [Nitrososphaerota archaeon]MDE1841881.1 aspartate kinase [Nitrososphaerota archaeon]MDE1878730.1 aspartate kinase [Nitrososphaerota archaeon]
MKLVLKFGGTSVSSPQNIQNVSTLIKKLTKEHKIIPVFSAISGVTDDLIRITHLIQNRNKEAASSLAKKIIKIHTDIAEQCVKNSKIKKDLISKMKADLDEFEDLLHGMLLLGEVTPRSSDYMISFGERLSINLVAFTLNEMGVKAIPLTGKDVGIVTDSNFGGAKPLMDTTRLHVSHTVEDLLQKKAMPVIGGFAGADQHGNITTFGRGGSDYTATIIASSIKADEVWLMSDVDGLMTTDPKIVKDAKLIKEVSYIEAMEMALFGAKYIHPRALEPLVAKKIPLRIRNTFNIDNLGTLVTATPQADTQKTVKCVSTIRHTGLIDVRGGSMVGAPGTAATIFSILAKEGINIMMISQSPSESSISIIVKKNDLDKAVNALEMNLLGKVIKKVDVTVDVSILALIGSGMRGITGVASKVFTAVAKKGVNVIMIAQGSSELNLAFVVKDSDCNAAVQALHDEFNLGK